MPAVTRAQRRANGAGARPRADSESEQEKQEQEHDEDLAVKPVHPLLDLAFGVLFISLVGRLSWQLHLDTSDRNTWTEGLAMGLPIGSQSPARVFGFFLVVVFVAVEAVKYCSGAVGTLISSTVLARRSLPKQCRDPLRSRLQRQKFTDQVWQLIVHCSMSYWEWNLIQGTTWWSDPGTAWEPCTIGPGRFEPSDSLRLFILMQLAIWTWTGFSCKYLEARRKDYTSMMTHHCVTIALVLFCYERNQMAFGMVVLFAHDFSDVFLDLMKIANYLKLEGPQGLFIVEILFVFNTYVSWVYLRLYYFPYVIAYQGFYLGFPPRCAHLYDSVYDMPSYVSANILFAVLECLHVFWFYLLNRIAWKLVQGVSPKHAGRIEYEGVEGREDNDSSKRK